MKVGFDASMPQYLLLLTVILCAIAQEDQLPVYHLTRESGHWINDPNGPFYDPVYQTYHLFAQYNPTAPVWGNMSWLHWQSKDLVQWELLPAAIYNDQSYDIGGAFSGSIEVLQANQTPLMLYTCVDAASNERQCLAFPSNSSDSSRTAWTKSSSNPFLDFTSLPAGCQAENFRDPSLWPKSDKSGYWVAIAAELSGVGTVALYDCVFAHSGVDFTTKCTYHTSLWSSASPTAAYTTYMVECPDFFSVDENEGLYVLKYSVMEQRREVYELGRYEESTGTFTRSTDSVQSISAEGTALQPGQLEYDLGPNNHFYASKTFLAPAGGQKEGQRVLWGWLPENDDASDRTWSGVMSFPRLVTYSPLWRCLTFSPFPALFSLRIGNTHQHFQMNNQILNHFDNESKGVYLVPLKVSSLASEVKALFHIEVPTTPTASSAECVLEVGLLGRTEAQSNYDQITTTMPRTYVKHSIGIAYNAGKLTLYSMVDASHVEGNAHPDIVTKQLPGDLSAWLASHSKHSTGSVGFDIDMDMFYDHSVTEMFSMEGVGVATTRIYPQAENEGLVLYAKTCNNAQEKVIVHAVDSWQMGSVWR